MELKEGMSVRTKHKGICRINGFASSLTDDYIENEKGSMIPKDEIIKASYNIIDLIEVGDVISTNNICGQVTSIEGDKIYTTCYDGECCYDYQIQSIVTKEQFSKMEYKID